MNNESKRPTREEVKAFVTELVKTNNSIIHAVAHSYLGENYRYLAEDVVGELWLLVCTKAEFLYTHDNPAGWIINSTKNIARNTVRRSGNELMTVPLDEAYLLSDNKDIFDDTEFAENEIDMINATLSVLSTRELEIFKYIYIHGITVADIAKRLNVKPNTVRNIHKNIKDKLRKEINRKIN